MRAALAALLLILPGAALGGTLSGPVFGLSLEERFDSAALAGGESELMSKVSPEAGWRARNERLRFEALYSLDLIQHARAGNITVDHRARLELRDRLSQRFALRATGAFFRVEDMASLPRFGVARTRAPALWGWGELAGDWRAGHLTNLELGYRGEATRLFMSGYPLGTSHSAWGRLRLLTGRRSELGVRLRGQVFVADTARYADTASPTLSARWLFSRHSFVALEGGALLYRSDRGNAVVPRGDLELGYEARGILLGLVVGHDVVGAAGYAEAVWADYVQAAFTWRMTRTWNAWLGAGYFRNGRAPSDAADADGLNGTAGVEWRLTRGLALTGTYDHLEQFAADATGLGLSRDIVTLRLSYRTP